MARFSPILQRPINRSDLSLLTSTTLSADTTGDAVYLGDASVMNLTVETTAISGTPTAVVYIEGSDDAGVTWYTLAIFGKTGANLGSNAAAPTAFDAASQEVHAAIPAAEYVRYRYDITGTTSFTLSIGGSYVS